MDKLVIQGGYPLEGEIPVSGAKNSALPALAACLLTADPVKLSRVPRVRDIATMEKLLKHIHNGAELILRAKVRRRSHCKPMNLFYNWGLKSSRSMRQNTLQIFTAW